MDEAQAVAMVRRVALFTVAARFAEFMTRPPAPEVVTPAQWQEIIDAAGSLVARMRWLSRRPELLEAKAVLGVERCAQEVREVFAHWLKISDRGGEAFLDELRAAVRGPDDRTGGGGHGPGLHLDQLGPDDGQGLAR